MVLDTPTFLYNKAGESVPHSTKANAGGEFPNSLAEAGLRDFNDPTGQFRELPIEEFLEKVAEMRHANNVRGLGHVAGHEVILLEGMHCVLDGGAGVPLPIEQDRQHQIIQAAHDSTQSIAEAVGETADELILQHERKQERLHLLMNKLPSHLILSSMVLAAVAHEGVHRQSGRHYYSHAENSASIMRVAWQKQGFETDDPLFEIAQFLDYLHDGPEENIDPYGDYISKDIPVTPLVAAKILANHAMPDSRNVARSLVYMMHNRDAYGNRLDYDPYVRRGIYQPGTVGLYVMLGKGPDNHDNHHMDPKKPPIDRAAKHQLYIKERKYEDSEIHIRQAAEAHGPDIANLFDAVFNVSREEQRAASAQNMPLNESAVAASVRRRQAARIAALTARDVE